jgi:hypothetical protein
MLTFDVEEFDTPEEYGGSLPFSDQILMSEKGTHIILDILQSQDIKATFFCTANFAKHSPESIERIVREGHEIASHGYYHSRFETEHLKISKQELENISGLEVTGYRMARMMPVENEELIEAGYQYNSSLNPVLLPGRYNNLSKPRTVFKTGSLVQVPASATPRLRIPLFWLSFHNMPLSFYKRCCSQTINADNYLNLYFHPWEFLPLTPEQYKLPKYVCRNSGKEMVARFTSLLTWMKHQGYGFITMGEFTKQQGA